MTSFLFEFILDFIQNICVLTRLYSLDIISITIPDFASDFRLVFLSSRLVFTRINFDLFQHCLFYALTLYLFNSSACYKQTSMLIQVCFMLVLAILRLSDVFSSVLGVVYRLGLK